jgi:hypothetical protein
MSLGTPRTLKLKLKNKIINPKNNNKMKRKLYTFTFAAAMAFALVFAGSCKDDDESVVTPALSVDKTSIAANQTGGTYDLAVTANIAWTASASGAFVTLSPGSGNGNAAVKVTVAANTDSDTRTATITVSGEGVESKTVTVTQPGTAPVLTVAPATLNFPASGGEGQAAQVTANVAWTASAPNWITVTPSSGAANADLTVTATANTGAVRNATITFSATGVASQTIEVTQAAASIDVSAESIPIDANGTRRYDNWDDVTDTLTVTASVAWTVAATTLPADNPTLAPAHTEAHEWVSVRQDGNFLIYSIDGNPYPRARAATITVSADGMTPKTIAVTQEARTQQFVGGSVVGYWEAGAPALTETSAGSGIFELARNFASGIFKLPLKDEFPTAFFAAGTADEVVAVDGAEQDLYFVPLTISWGAAEIDLKWQINTAGYYKLTVNLNTMKVKLESATPPPDPNGETIAGQFWAKFNTDADKAFAAAPDALGKFYQFYYGATAYSATDPLTPAWQDGSGAPDRSWPTSPDPIPCPTGWTLPTDSNLSTFVNAGSTWAAAGTKGNAVAGRFFGANHAAATISDPQGCIFIPAAGRRASTDGTLIDAGVKGFVHSQNPYYGVTTQALVFDENGATVVRINNTSTPGADEVLLGTGMSVRCIKQ